MNTATVGEPAMNPSSPITLPFPRSRFEHVFVLCTGRCGSVSLAKACSHFTNYTSGHETNRSAGPARIDYPRFHIEIDNRLAWFLGALEERYGDRAYYLHLVRDESRVAESYDRRWHHHGSLMRAFDEGICGHSSAGPHAAAELAATVNANIRGFLRDKTHVLVGDIEDTAAWFPRFIADIAAEGDSAAAIAEFALQHNATCLSAHEDSIEAVARRTRVSLPVARLTERAQALEAKTIRLAAEKARLETRLRNMKRLTTALAVPWLIATAPLSVPIGLYALANRRSNRRAGGRRGLFGGRPWWRRRANTRTLVYDAFLTHRSSGPDAAARLLADAGQACPAGAADLFRAIDAPADDDWLAAMNRWGHAAALPPLALRPGPEPRFHRISFPESEPVLSRDKVSVIMPAFNARQTIEQAARSILAQSWRNLELIIVDDASDDGTADVAQRLTAADPRVRVLRNPVNVGPYVSKNRALLAASGRYVTGHDADDIAIPSRIADQMQPIRADAACAASIAFMIRIDPEGRFSYPTKIGPYSYDGIARRAMISLLIDRDVLLSRLGFWDTVRFGADSEMLARATAVLGPGLSEVRKVVMLCLDAAGSLTNNAEHGVSAWDGVAPIRQHYRDAWAAWHGATRPEQRRLPFPHLDRLFAAPHDMLVPAAAMQAVAAADAAVAGRRAA